MNSIIKIINTKFSHKVYKYIRFNKKNFFESTSYYGCMSKVNFTYGIHFNPLLNFYFMEYRSKNGNHEMVQINILDAPYIPDILRRALGDVARTHKTMLTPKF